MEERVLRYAPLLRFSRHETHFPIDPALFISRSRLRRLGWTASVPDGYWNSELKLWDCCGVTDAPPPTAVNPDLPRACAAIQTESPSAPSARRNRRPNDPANLWNGSRAGYALELTQAFARELRGVAGSAPFLLYDRYGWSDGEHQWDLITYWFFYALNPHLVAHEGDWEPVSVLVRDGDATAVLRLDSRNGAGTLGFDEVELVDGTHPVIYVEAGSHRACSSRSDLNGSAMHTVMLRSWRLPPKSLREMSWSSFDGAWGRVGAIESTTGPLGPLLRRTLSVATPEHAVLAGNSSGSPLGPSR